MGAQYGEMDIEIGKVDMRAAKLREDADKARGTAAKARAQWAFLSAVISAEDLHAAAKGGTVEDCDLPSLGGLYATVTAEIDRPEAEAQERMIAQRLAAFDVDKLSKIMDAAKMLGAK